MPELLRRMSAAACALVWLMAPSSATPATGATARVPATVELTDDGPVLVNADGMTLYYHNPDEARPGHSLCPAAAVREFPDVVGGYGSVPVVRAGEMKSCTDKFPPLMATAGDTPIGGFTLIDREEGGKQWAYHGRPLYRSIKDARRGERNGIMGSRDRFSLALASDAVPLPAGIELASYGEDLVLTGHGGKRTLFTPRTKARLRKATDCGGCDALLAPVSAPEMAVGRAGFSVLQPQPGERQYAYEGKPLYEVQSGVTIWDVERLGEWEPVVFRKGADNPPAIGKQVTLTGEIYTDVRGRTLYQFYCTTGLTPSAGINCDDPGDPARYWAALCNDAQTCSQRWKPYLAEAGARASGNWSIVEVPSPMFTDQLGTTYPAGVPRVRAWAYRGKPVFTYFLDEMPRDIKGHKIRWTGNRSFMTVVRVPGRGVPGGEY